MDADAGKGQRNGEMIDKFRTLYMTPDSLSPIPLSLSNCGVGPTLLPLWGSYQIVGAPPTIEDRAPPERALTRRRPGRLTIGKERF